MQRSGLRLASSRSAPIWKVGDVVLHGAAAEDNAQTRLVFSKDTKDFLSELNRQFAYEVVELSKHRKGLHESIRRTLPSGQVELPTLAGANDPNWKVAPTPEVLQKRRVEITGPANDAKMVINMLNSGADACMIDLEDAMAPSGKNVVEGHFNIYKAARGELVYEQPLGDGKFKRYQIGQTPSTLMVRVRGLHMKEVHATAAHVGPVPATLFDIGVHLANNGKYLQDHGLGPFLYIPKLHSGVEAEVLEKVLAYCEKQLQLTENGTKVTTLIETLPAIFQTEEIAYALKNRIVGQNCGRWDWLASRNYYLSGQKEAIHPDREYLGMEQSFNKAYSQRVCQTAKKRGFHAMGGMSAFIPVSGDQAKTAEAIQKVVVDKALEIENGHDGAWVAHPGMVEAVLDQFKKAFGDAPHQKSSSKSVDAKISTKDIIEVPKDLQDASKRTEKGLRQNISVALQYMGHYLQGNGAAGINNMMEDLATFEMSRHHIRSWVDSKVEITFADGSKKPLTWEVVEKILAEEAKALSASGLPIETAQEVLWRGLQEYPEYISRISGDYVNPEFGRGLVIGDRVLRPLQNTGGQLTPEFKSIKFDDDLVRSLLGCRPSISGGAEMVKHRGRFLNRLLQSGTCYKYMGCASGLAAAAVVHGGQGLVGPYCGGWQINAMGLEESRPDTLWVKPEDPGNLALKLNNFLGLQDKIQMVDTIHQLQALRSLPQGQFREGLRALQSQVNTYSDFHDISILADLEQGYGDVKYTRYGVTKAIQNGISMLHIEDQGPKKRCGHLGDKELDTFDHAIEIMTAANYAAQEVLGPEQAKENLCRFVFRTDALSATRIVYSKAVEDPSHIDHKYIDWDRGFCPDGRYLWLKKDTNPATGNPYGLDQSIDRASEMVRRGLASFVWMETPDAEVRIAQAFLEGVNERLKNTGRQALGLYNFSPSFIWDKNYYPDAKKLALQVATFAQDNLISRVQSGAISHEQAMSELKQFLDTNGDKVRGDHLFTTQNLERLYSHAMDHCRTANGWSGDITKANDLISQQFASNLKFRLQREIERTQQGGYNPVHHMSNIVVGQRIKHFSSALEKIGFMAQLITLPQFHTEAERGYSVARAYQQQGIEGYVQHVQRVEEHLPSGYTFLGHQKAVGTGVEAQLYENLFAKASAILHDSTEKHFH
uniref:malate synthase n=1 Tax=Euglena gracilis TaxID=3039 RepID=Q8LPA6_EUGGR|nr:malate synthase-isocitrate lyase [Euglena gracilis]